MEKGRKESVKKRLLALLLAAVVAFCGFLSGIAIGKFAGTKEETVSVYSVESLWDKKWSGAVTVSAVVETGTVKAYYYDSRCPVTELYVTEGQAVTAGTILYRCDSAEFDTELSVLKMSLDNEKVYLKRLESYIETLKNTKPVMDGLGSRGGFYYASLGGGLLRVPLSLKAQDEPVDESSMPSEEESSEQSSEETEPFSESGVEETEQPSENNVEEAEQPSESSDEMEQPSGGSSDNVELPDFDGNFDDAALEEALGDLDSAPQGYTKEELTRVIKERTLEYENLELAIRKKEKQAEELKRKIDACVVKAEEDGTVQRVLDPVTAASQGQPVFELHGINGCRIRGQFNEFLASSLVPGAEISVETVVNGKKTSLPAKLQSISREPEEAEAFSASMTEKMGLSVNPAMSYYSFTASFTENPDTAEGTVVEIMVAQAVSAGETETGRIVLPDAWLFYEGGQSYVYAMGTDGRLEKRSVVPGRSIFGAKTEILSGISAEDYLADPRDSLAETGRKTKIVYGKEMEIGEEETREE
ncbi:biotin/lipoyl-binding protein [Fusibacillus kribbianus]|uniref:Biotin/lipoyl-binding protein n=1 Tax=Fusibacillus kribbianus TaxID=3044208 RepID=A0AAP4EX15_9FIRM|nr:biotin/lipoyl-binding protein [Ruminococcus sp. YH-rum2234]MDI9242079.1 biotin/lipoyl-binding protein [Ruminococcus sp. YH-rum2234]